MKDQYSIEKCKYIILINFVQSESSKFGVDSPSKGKMAFVGTTSSYSGNV